MSRKHKHRHKHRKTKVQKAPEPRNINKFLWAVTHKLKKHGRRYYKKRRRIDRTVRQLLSRYKIKGTNSEFYWELKAVNILLGNEVAYL